MFTEYLFKGKTYQFNTEASLKMGKDAFIKAHKGIPNIKIVWDMIEAKSDSEKPKASKK